jgi:hypothetical protein
MLVKVRGERAVSRKASAQGGVLGLVREGRGGGFPPRRLTPRWNRQGGTSPPRSRNQKIPRTWRLIARTQVSEMLAVLNAPPPGARALLMELDPALKMCRCRAGGRRPRPQSRGFPVVLVYGRDGNADCTTRNLPHTHIMQCRQ